jgi:hypothetical protein
MISDNLIIKLIVLILIVNYIYYIKNNKSHSNKNKFYKTESYIPTTKEQFSEHFDYIEDKPIVKNIKEMIKNEDYIKLNSIFVEYEKQNNKTEYDNSVKYNNEYNFPIYRKGESWIDMIPLKLKPIKTYTNQEYYEMNIISKN